MYMGQSQTTIHDRERMRATRTIFLLLLSFGFLNPAQVRSEERSMAEIIAAADAVIEKIDQDNVAAVKEVSAVFEAAHRLLKENGREKSEFYFLKGLQLSPWEMEQQLAYAKLLQAQGKTDASASTARMVFQTSESGKLLEESAKLAGLSLPVGIPLLPVEPLERKAICFVRLGEVEEWIIQSAGMMLSDKLGTPVYIFPDVLKLPAPTRSFFARWAGSLKKNIKWENEFVKQQMLDLGIASEDAATADQTLELIARLEVAMGQEDPRAKLQKFSEDARERDQQWDASLLLTQLKTAFPERDDVVFVGITAADIYAKDNNYLFGFAQSGSGYCLLSYRRYTAWFNRERENQSRFLERIHKQILSSVGFALGIARPVDPRSARSYPNSLEDHDLKGTWLSPECIKGFEASLKHPLPEKTKEQTAGALRQ